MKKRDSTGPVGPATGGAPSGEDARRFRVVCLGLDGTLIPGTTVYLHLAGKLGHNDVLADLERRYAAGEISQAELADRDGRFYAGRTRAEVFAHLEDIPQLAGIPETLDRLKGAGMTRLLAAITWRLAADFFQRRYGFDAACGTEMGEDAAGRLTGQVTRYCDEAAKAAFAAAYCQGRGIPLDECVAIGDSRSDIPLFRQVGLARDRGPGLARGGSRSGGEPDRGLGDPPSRPGALRGPRPARRRRAPVPYRRLRRAVRPARLRRPAGRRAGAAHGRGGPPGPLQRRARPHAVVLASILVSYGLRDDAVAEIRRVYQPRAMETPAQEAFVHRLALDLHGAPGGA